MGPARDRQLTIDTLRGLACLLLVGFHVVVAAPRGGPAMEPGHWLRELNDALGFLRMPLFAFLSGLVYAARPASGLSAGFVRGKARRLLVPMLIVGTLYAVAYALSGNTAERSVVWSRLHIVPVAHYWFLESMFLVFIGVAALEGLGVLRRERNLWMFGLVAALAHVFNNLTPTLGLYGAVYLLPAFLLGLWMRRFGIHHRRDVLLKAAFAIFTITLATVVFEGRWPARISAPTLTLGLSACVFLFVLAPASNALAAIGRVSFAIYLFHTFFTGAARIALIGLGAQSLAVVVIGSFVMGVIGPIVTDRLLRRVPVVGWWALGERPPRRPAAWAPSTVAGT